MSYDLEGSIKFITDHDGWLLYTDHDLPIYHSLLIGNIGTQMDVYITVYHMEYGSLGVPERDCL